MFERPARQYRITTPVSIPGPIEIAPRRPPAPPKAPKEVIERWRLRVTPFRHSPIWS